jgi:hypothetical protein
MPDTIASLIDRILRDWMLPPDDQPVRFRLSSSIDASTTTLPYDPDMLPPEVEQALSPGVVVEIDRELIILGTVAPGQSQVTNCTRGALGTLAAPHTPTSLVNLAPPYSRQSVFDAVSNAITTLYPQLYHLHTSTLTVTSDFIEIPSDYISPQALVVLNGPNEIPAELHEYPHYPPSSTGKAVRIDSIAGSTAYFTYRSRCHTPTSETDELFTDLGVEPDWSRVIEVDVVAQLIAGRDLEGYVLETLSRRLDQEAFPPLTASRLHQNLVRYHEYLLDRAARALKARDGLPQLHGGAFSG